MDPVMVILVLVVAITLIVLALGKRNRNILFRTVTVDMAQAHVDTDGSGDVVITIPELRRINGCVATVSQPAGYVANMHTISGNTVKVRVFQEQNDGKGAGVPLVAVLNANNVAALQLIAEGY